MRTRFWLKSRNANLRPNQFFEGLAKLFAVAPLLLVSFVVCCGFTRSNPGKFKIVNRPIIQYINFIGRTNITASCLPGDQMLGGGYVTSNFTNGYPPIMVEASYPSSLTNWTVTIVNPDTNYYGPHWNQQVRVDCYCVTTPNFDLGMQIVSNQVAVPSIFTDPTIYTNTSISKDIVVKAPNAGVITAGGFKTVPSHVSDQYWFRNASAYNACIADSVPYITNSKAIGWRVRQVNFFGPQLLKPLTTTVYALYSTKNLSASIPVGQFLNYAPYWLGLGFQSGKALCKDDEFVAGGGFELIESGTPVYSPYVIPHQVNLNVAVDCYTRPTTIVLPTDPFSGWSIEGLYGWQNSTANGEQTTGNLKLWAIPLKIPVVGTTVKITTPINGASFPLSQTAPIKTQPITFTVVASDTLGAPLPEGNIKWTGELIRSTSPIKYFSFGTGSSLSQFFLTAGKYKISVIAKDNSNNTASDSIVIYVYYPIQ